MPHNIYIFFISLADHKQSLLHARMIMNKYTPLTVEQMREVTGAKTKSRMITVLISARIPYWLRADGWPTTTYLIINDCILGKADSMNQRQRQSEPVQPANTKGFNLKSAG